MSNNSVWTFSLTEPFEHGDSSDEDEGNNSKPEDQLSKDIDLSSREEALKYTPNPFSIAKINAALRSRNIPSAVFSNLQGRDPTIRPKKCHVTQRQEDIREAFRRQAQRSHTGVGVSVGRRQTQMGSELKAGVTEASPAACAFGEILKPVSEAFPGSGNTSRMNESLSILIAQPKIVITQLISSPNWNRLRLQRSTLPRLRYAATSVTQKRIYALISLRGRIYMPVGLRFLRTPILPPCNQDLRLFVNCQSV